MPGVDVKEPEYGPTAAHEFELLDLTKAGCCLRATRDTRLRQVLKWEPALSLEDGLERTYHWIAGELAKSTETVGAVATD